MNDPRELLKRLLEYIGEQAIAINPKSYSLAHWPHFKCFPKDIAGLPGVDSDVKVQGDHIWLRIQRLVADKPPTVTSDFARFLAVSLHPSGPPPHLDESAFQAQISEAASDMDLMERAQYEEGLSANINAYIDEYTPMWNAWAAGEIFD
ncbi:MAG TPA: hypothetical protein VI457_13075 [Methylococcaceae bacterium]|nr:hypothetical protein [Methylococcaceae bacterium]